MRVCLVSVVGDGKFEMTQSKYRLTEEQKQDDGQKLFDFCAECLKIFIEQQQEGDVPMIRPGQELPLGFTVRAHIVVFVVLCGARAGPIGIGPLSAIPRRQRYRTTTAVSG